MKNGKFINGDLMSVEQCMYDNCVVQFTHVDLRVISYYRIRGMLQVTIF